MLRTLIHVKTASAASRAVPSTRANSLRRFEASGAVWSPNPAYDSAETAGAHSPIAVTDFAPAVTALTATASNPASG